jgi:NAD(P)H-dependent FMN reductase
MWDSRPLRLAVIIGSTRHGRFGPTVAAWFAGQAGRRPELDVDLIDLADAGLPADLVDQDEEVPGAVLRLAPRLALADAFAIVTPEYNCSFPAPLKTAIDWFYDEWQAKPVAFISYGRESGGSHAVAQLREVFAELHAVTVRDTVCLPRFWEQYAADGSWPRAAADCNTAVVTVLDRLTWWARALRTARAEQPYTT